MFAPVSRAALRYNDVGGALPSDRFAQTTIEAVRAVATKVGLRAVVPDARLFDACADLATILPPSGVLSSDVVEFALQRSGIVEPSPNLVVMWGALDAPQIADEIASRFAAGLEGDSIVRFGIGRAVRMPDGTGAIVFAALPSAVETGPMPRALPAGGTLSIRASLDARYRDPEVMVTRDSGEVERVAVTRTAGSAAFAANVVCSMRGGRQQIEILATGTRGIKVLANFPVWCGGEPPRTLVLEASGDDQPAVDATSAERRLLVLINADRKRAGLAPLERDARLADVARAYSSEMQRTNVVAHVSPISGAAVDRVRAAGIKTGLVLENIARAYSVGEIHRGLMDSPGHRGNILSAQATHLGIGVVFGERVADRSELFATQVFTRVPPRVDIVAARAALQQKIAAAAPNLPTPMDSPELAAIAQRFADALAAGKAHAVVYPEIAKQLDAVGPRFRRVASTVTASGELESFDARAVVNLGVPDALGIGVAQGVHPEIGEGAIWVVVLSAQRR